MKRCGDCTSFVYISVSDAGVIRECLKKFAWKPYAESNADNCSGFEPKEKLCNCINCIHCDYPYDNKSRTLCKCTFYNEVKQSFKDRSCSKFEPKEKEMEETKAFWMVKRDDNNPTSFMHSTWESARDEAMKLARKHPGSRFYILRTIEVYEVDVAPIKITKL